jgi:hypothetical protein
MKLNFNLTRWTRSTITALAVAGSAGLCQAAAPIVYDFSSGLQGWAGHEPAGMAATYSINPTGSSTGGPCMQIVMDGAVTTEMDPIVTLASTLNTMQWLRVSVHLAVDASSGTTGTMGSGGYGSLQAILRDSSYSWDSMWYGTLYSPAAQNWTTYTFAVAPPYHASEQYLQFQLQCASSTTNYTGPVTVYIDNVTITPVPNPWVMDAFTSDTSASYAVQTWSTAETSSLNTSQDAGGGFTPVGALQMDIAFPATNVAWSEWGQSWIENDTALGDLTRFTYFECDLKVDTANSTLFSDGSDYGNLTIAFRDAWSGNSGPYACSPSGIPLSASTYSSWHHLKLALPTAGSGGLPITNSPGYDIELSGNCMGPVRLLMDNITLSKPITPPKIYGLLPGTPGGVKIAVDADGTSNQFDQEGFTSPSADNDAIDFFWVNRTPATYSFALTNFPAPAVAPGFHAHVYLVNGDSITANGKVGSWSYNETYSGVPYNALDYAGLWIQNTTNNTGVLAILEWKTNSPTFNATNKQTLTLTQYASANGPWTLTFSDNTHATLLGPDSTVAGSFTLPDFANDPNYSANFTPGTSLVQFGVAKNDTQNTGVNNNQSATFTHVLVTNATAGVIYDDNFTGPGLTSKYAWQVAEYYQDSANRVFWQPYGTAYWLEWGEPATGYAVKSAAAVTGPWTDAGVTYTYADSTGTNHFGAIPAASLPSANTGFFRLANPNP